MDQLKAGAAKVCINPTQDMYPIPNLVGDFGMEPVPQVEPYDDMNCRAIAVESCGKKILFLTFELGGAPDFPGYPDDISKATGIDSEYIFITATHNHADPRYRKRPSNTPELNEFIEKYEKIIYAAGIEASKKAVESMRPARYGYGESVSDINVNRDLLTFGGYWVEARNPVGYSDKTLSILKFVDMEGKLIAAFLNHGTHATNLYCLKDKDHKMKTSGNFTGVACRFVEDHYGNGAVALWTSGAAGNQNPKLSHGVQYEYPDGWTSQVQYPDGTGFIMMEYMGRYHGADCCRGIDAITRYMDRMPISHMEKVIDLPTNKPTCEWPPKDIGAFRNGGQGERDYDEIPYGQIPGPAKTPERKPSDPRKLHLHLLKMGHVAMFFANAELFAEIGRDVKEASPYKNTVIVTHHYGEKCQYIFDKTSTDVEIPMAYGGVIPGSSDELIANGVRELCDEII